LCKDGNKDHKYWKIFEVEERFCSAIRREVFADLRKICYKNSKLATPTSD
jgi:hypothetical protein